MPEKNRTKWGKIHRPITSRGRTQNILEITIMTFSPNHFNYGIAQSIGDTAVAYGLTAARWAVLTYDAVTSDRAVAAYHKGWTIARATMLFCLGLGILTRRAIQRWVDAEVADKLPSADHTPDSGKMVAAVAATVAAPIAVARVEATGPVAVSLPPIRVLKQMARGKVKGYYNMKQAELWEALGRPAWPAIE
jgi:hypothetical protein